MNIVETSLSGVLIIEPDAFEDHRGFFMETYQKKKYAACGIGCVFVQDNLSYSIRGTLRGLHYQYPHEQAKLVQVIAGEIYDVAVDIRKGSPSFGKWIGTELSDANRRQLYIPEGFAHGFCVLSKAAFVAYKCTNLYAPASEGGVLWSDPDLGINWPVRTPLLSDKDGAYARLADIPADLLPEFKESMCGF